MKIRSFHNDIQILLSNFKHMPIPICNGKNNIYCELYCGVDNFLDIYCRLGDLKKEFSLHFTTLHSSNIIIISPHVKLRKYLQYKGKHVYTMRGYYNLSFYDVAYRIRTTDLNPSHRKTI